MARKRQSSEMGHESGKQSRQRNIQYDLRALGERAGIDLLYHEANSPEKLADSIKYQAVSNFNFLFWKDKEMLQEAVDDFLQSLRRMPSASQGQKTSLLVDKLRARSKPLQDAMTPSKAADASAVQLSSPCPSPAPSPTRKSPSLGLKGSFKATKAGASRPPSPSPWKPKPGVSRIDASPIPGPYFPPKSVNASFKLPPQPDTRISNAQTSFASTAATTSFGQKSFSSTQSTQNSIQTEATSFSEDMPPPAAPRSRKDDSISMSSFDTDTAQQLRNIMAHAENSQKSSESMTRPQRPPFDRPTTSESSEYETAPTSPLNERMKPRRMPTNSDSQDSARESEYYGSSLGASTVDGLYDGHYAYGPSSTDVELTDAYSHNQIENPRSVYQPTRAPYGSPQKAPSSPSRQTAMRFEPVSGFAQMKIPSSFQNLPYTVQWEAQRLLQTGHITADELAARWKAKNLETLYDIASSTRKPFHRAWDPFEIPDFKNVTMSGKLTYAQSGSGPVFDLVLNAPKKDKDCDLQRKFGPQRCLYVDMPSLSKPPDLHAGRGMRTRFLEMASTPQTFLGQRWILYLVQPNKRNKKSSNPESAKAGTTRLVFFAINHDNIRDLFDYVLPFEHNGHQAAQKVYTRLELMTSRTTQTTQFEKEDIDFMADDQYATRDADDVRFLDPNLRRDKAKCDPERNFDAKKEMSDGCAEMSFWAYWQAHQALGLTEVHSALQARICGAKGVWFRPREDFGSLEQKPRGKHIKLTKSQVKVLRKDLTRCDPESLVLNVVKPNALPRPSALHTGFMPILQDRGVPKQAMLDVIRTQVRAEMREYEQAVTDGAEALRRWMHSQNELFEERNRTQGLQELAGFPARREERIVQMLEAGFDPRTCPYLAREVKLLARQVFDLKRKHYKIKLSRSTTLMGVSDPLGILKPGEVQVNFSKPFAEASGMSWIRLHDMLGLIARNPAMAPWDIQKIRFVCYPELEHMRDVVIFPSKGRRPLAGILQGGDYDGDTFWLCWEPKLVDPFKNAPCPWEPPPPEHLNIQKETKKLCDYIQDPDSEQQWCAWLAEMGLARTDFNLLGIVTKYHERLIYATGNIRSAEALALVHLHDYLVDADKQGYVFDKNAFAAFRKSWNLPNDLPDPSYCKFTTLDDEDQPTDYAAVTSNVKDNVIDDAYFKIIAPTIKEYLTKTDLILSINDLEDSDLPKFFDQTWTSLAEEPTPRDELTALKLGLQGVREFWGVNAKSMPWNDFIAELRLRYDNIQPAKLTHPAVKEWLRRAGNDTTIWEKLKASALAKFQHRASGRSGNFIFAVAGYELCALKVHYIGRPRMLCMDQYRMLKLRKIRKTEIVDEYESDTDEVEVAGPVEDTAYY